MLAARAKERSIHNNYLTFPVIVLMLSSHFASLYGHRLSWLLLGILVLAGAAVRHLLNIRFTYPRWRPALAATAVAALAMLYLLAVEPKASTAPVADSPEPRTASFAQAHAVIDKRCTVCHSASPADRTFGIAPAGVAFDTPEQIRVRADRILARAVETQTMPPGNKTWITPEERERGASGVGGAHTVRRWIMQAAWRDAEMEARGLLTRSSAGFAAGRLLPGWGLAWARTALPPWSPPNPGGEEQLL